MPDVADPKTKENHVAENQKTHYCQETVGSCQCTSKVSRGCCPSNFESINEISKVEHGRETCYGQS